MTGFTSLVVEADPLARRLTAQRLTHLGASEVIEAASAKEALIRVGAATCQVCVIDLDLADASVSDVVSWFHDHGCRSLLIQPRHPQADLADLSAREIGVLEMVAAGSSNKEIGAAMRLSALTVKNHLARMARKLGTGDRAGMVARGMRTGVIS